MARGARAIFVALCLLTLAKIVLACDAAHYLNSIRAGDADAVSLCLTSGLVVRPIRDENGLSGLQLAVKLGHKQVGLLIAKHALASLRSVEVSAGAGTSSDMLAESSTNCSTSQFFDAVHDSDIVSVVSCLNAGFSLNATESGASTALMVAAARGHARVVRLLLRHGADINARSDDGHTALMLASYAGKNAAVAALLAWQRSAPLVDVQSNLGLTALMEAAGEGHVGVVRRLLAHRVPAPPSVDIKSAEGHTALAYACARGKAAIVRALLARSPADVNTLGGEGKHSPLMLACAQGHVGAVRALLEHHTPPDRELRGADGFTALDYASERGYFDIVRLLRRPAKQQPSPSVQT